MRPSARAFSKRMGLLGLTRSDLFVTAAVPAFLVGALQRERPAVIGPDVTAGSDAAAPHASAPPDAHLATKPRTGLQRAESCAAVVADDEPRAFEEAIAAAVLRDYDIEQESVAVERLDAGAESTFEAYAVANCRGERLETMRLNALPVGGVRVVSRAAVVPPDLADAGLAGSVLARIVVGGQLGLCDNPEGFLALVSLRHRRVEVDAIGPFAGRCGSDPNEEMTLMRFGQDAAVLLADNDGGESGFSRGLTEVYLRRGARFVHAGSFTSRLDQWHIPADGPRRKIAMTSTLEPSADGFVARETWTWQAVDARGEPREGPPLRRRIIERRYWADGDVLKRSPDDEPDP